MIEWFAKLNPVVQAAVISACATILVAVIKEIPSWIKQCRENKTSTVSKQDIGNKEPQIGIQIQDGARNVQNNYYNCNVQQGLLDDKNSVGNNKFIKRQIEKYIDEHLATEDDIAKLLDDDIHIADGRNINNLNNAKSCEIMEIPNSSGGITVIIDDVHHIKDSAIVELKNDIENNLHQK